MMTMRIIIIIIIIIIKKVKLAKMSKNKFLLISFYFYNLFV